MPTDGHPLTKADLDASLKAIQSGFADALTSTKDELTEKMRQIETNLLTEFHRYAKG